MIGRGCQTVSELRAGQARHRRLSTTNLIFRTSYRGRYEALLLDNHRVGQESNAFHADWDVFDVSGPQGVKFDLNLLLDVDADGDLDVINSEENDNARDGKPGLGVIWYELPATS